MVPIRLLTDQDASAMARLMLNAYPGYDLSPNARQTTEDWVRREVKRGEEDRLAGWFEADGALSGGIRILTQPMNLRMKQVNAIGLGALCVDLLHKKKKIALELLRWSFEEARKSGISMAVLDPFNIGFYKKMGCGIAVKHHQFRLAPSQLPDTGDRNQVKELTRRDYPAIMAYQRRYFRQHHGMLQRAEHEVKEVLDGCQMILGVWEQEQLAGVMPIRFQRTGPDNVFRTHLIVEELLYNHTHVLQAFLSFLHAQADQIVQVIFTSQDRFFEALFENPDTGCDDTFHTRKNEIYRTGNGMMIRILDVPRVMETVEVPDRLAERLPLRVALTDPMMLDQAGKWIFSDAGGRLAAKKCMDNEETDGTLDITDLASLVMGAVDMDSLLRYGRVQAVHPARMGVLGELLHYPVAPVCLSRF
ncbi:MAG: GNAT family N-acetyltransferase [Bacillota bacterium]|nr:GNAT family N-acetyltransferase [Bacillota bacterium]MDW7676278.1 GNAT family N-acetyltransferase [Bacillota bacterium]